MKEKLRDHIITLQFHSEGDNVCTKFNGNTSNSLLRHFIQNHKCKTCGVTKGKISNVGFFLWRPRMSVKTS